MASVFVGFVLSVYAGGVVNKICIKKMFHVEQLSLALFLLFLGYEKRGFLSHRPINTNSIFMSEGETPLILDAWPIVSGFMLFNFSLDSEEIALSLL